MASSKTPAQRYADRMNKFAQLHDLVDKVWIDLGPHWELDIGTQHVDVRDLMHEWLTCCGFRVFPGTVDHVLTVGAWSPFVVVTNEKNYLYYKYSESAIVSTIVDAFALYYVELTKETHDGHGYPSARCEPDAALHSDTRDLGLAGGTATTTQGANE